MRKKRSLNYYGLKRRKTNALKWWAPLGLKLKAYLELARIKNCLIAGTAILIGFYLAGGFSSPSQTGLIIIIITIASGVLVCSGGQTINDYFDSKIDLKTSKHRPIPSGRITKKEALLFSLVSFSMGIILSTIVNTTTLLIALTFTLLLIAYPILMNQIKYIGNIVVALGTAITFIYGASATTNIPLLVVVLSISAFFSNLGREITKDIEDLEKDKGAKKTLPLILGEKHATRYVMIYYSTAVLTAIWAYFAFSLNWIYLMLIIISLAIFSRSAKQLSTGNSKKSQSTSKKGMIISLIAFIIAGIK